MLKLNWPLGKKTILIMKKINVNNLINNNKNINNNNKKY